MQGKRMIVGLVQRRRHRSAAIVFSATAGQADRRSIVLETVACGRGYLRRDGLVVFDVYRRRISPTGRTSDADRRPPTPHPYRLVGACARLSKNRLTAQWPAYMDQGRLIAGARNCQTGLAEVRFAVAVHCQIGPFIGPERTYQFEHGAFVCTMKASN
jgi:hypothetical protein